MDRRHSLRSFVRVIRFVTGRENEETRRMNRIGILTASLVVEMQLPFQPSGLTSFAGSSATSYGTTYTRSATCGIPEFLTLADNGFPGFEWHLTVNGWAGEAPRCNADLDDDGDVDSADLGILLGHWGLCDLPRTCLGDLNGDVASADLGVMLSAFGSCP
jgi:hypothetical protein